ncbi:cytochrome c1 [Candidatus Albibeggiatoa sp. nov. NOAA]|uniref:cytochrome c1 n=1 Tax=Candidatus Albibeggiatoa sp. nov. NOAA TaxID=3162724 RepID=UPI0033021BBE|nr:cytochrome c1 [Thiotrichaceae bacterium]
MKRIILALTLLLPTLGFAAGGGAPVQKAYNDIRNTASLQNGAKLYMNYCAGCHSLNFMRYQRVADDLGLTKEQTQMLIFDPNKKIGDMMGTAMQKEDAAAWFGKAPPDLSVISRSRGTDWLYSYMISFYQDDSRPTGMNNLYFADVGMPHVMWDQQGMQKAVYHTEVDDEGHEHQVLSHLEPEDPAKNEAYKAQVLDLVNFLEYVGEPGQVQRLDLGWKVILFFFIMSILAFWMKKEFWRDVH